MVARLVVVGLLLILAGGTDAKQLRRLAAFDDTYEKAAAAATPKPASSPAAASGAYAADDHEQVLLASPVDVNIPSSVTKEQKDAVANVVLDSDDDEPSSGDLSRRDTAVKAANSADANELTVYIGDWGDWLDMTDGTQYGEADTRFACGAMVRFEAKQKGDDTAMNAISFAYCKARDWGNDQKWVNTNDGLWGDWQRRTLCPEGQFIVGAEMRYESPQGNSDDTAGNGLKIQCADPWDRTKTSIQTVYEGLWGDWKGMKFDKDRVMCGAKVRFEKDQNGGDDTALNGLILQMCPFVAAPLKDAFLSWNGPVSNSAGSSIEYTITKALTQEQWKERSESTSVEVKFEYTPPEATGGIGASFAVSHTLQSSSRQGLIKSLSAAVTSYCPNSCSNTEYVWQEHNFVKDITGAVAGEVFTCLQYCTVARIMPKCPLAACPKDNSCQTCSRDSSGLMTACKYDGTDIVS